MYNAKCHLYLFCDYGDTTYEQMSPSHPSIVTSCKEHKKISDRFKKISKAQIIRGWVCNRVIQLEEIHKRSNDLG
jgi:hypothetical protein